MKREQLRLLVTWAKKFGLYIQLINKNILDFGYSRIIPGYEMKILPEQAQLGKGGGR